MDNPTNKIAYLFVATWVVVIVVAYLYFDKNKNIPIKKRLYPIYAISSGLIFSIGCVLLVLFDNVGAFNNIGSQQLYIIICFIGFMMLLACFKAKATKFCDNCGKLNYPRGLIVTKYCIRCGSVLSKTVKT